MKLLISIFFYPLKKGGYDGFNISFHFLAQFFTFWLMFLLSLIYRYFLTPYINLNNLWFPAITMGLMWFCIDRVLCKKYNTPLYYRYFQKKKYYLLEFHIVRIVLVCLFLVTLSLTPIFTLKNFLLF